MTKKMKQLIEKAKEKGFESVIYKNQEYNFIENQSLKTHRYLYLCEIKKWLMDEHKICVTPFLEYNELYSVSFGKERSVDNQLIFYNSRSETEALMIGLKKALTLI